MIVLWNRSRQIGAWRRLVALTRPVALACLVVWWAGPAEARAGTESGFRPDAPEESCARGDPAYETAKGAGAGAPGTYPPVGAGEVGAEVPTWTTITLGSHERAGALREALRAAHCGIGELAEEVLHLPDFSVKESRTELSLIILSPADLGFGATGAPRAQIYRRATELGFALCPAEIGPQLRLQYLGRPPGEFLRIAMEPLTPRRRARVSLSVGNGGAGLLPIGGEVRPNAMVPRTARFVFVRQDLSVTSLEEGSGSLDALR